MLELMPMKTTLPTVEEFVKKVKEAYQKTGWQPAYGETALIFRCMELKRGCAVQVLNAVDAHYVTTIDMSQRGYQGDFTLGIIYGFDGLGKGKNNPAFNHGYACGQAARKAVMPDDCC